MTHVANRSDVESHWRAVVSGASSRADAARWARAATGADMWAEAGRRILTGLADTNRDATGQTDWGPEESEYDPVEAAEYTAWLNELHLTDAEIAAGLRDWQAVVAGAERRPLAAGLPERAASAWRRRWGDAPVTPWLLRPERSEQWVRFHSLPESKRYPETDAEYATVRARHQAVVDALPAVEPTWWVSLPLLQWRDEQPTVPVVGAVAPLGGTSTWWHDADPDDEDISWTHWLYAIPTGAWDLLDALLTAVADDCAPAARVVIGPAGWEWVYSPYDGGGDLFAADSLRLPLVEAHRDWLSPEPSGL